MAGFVVSGRQEKRGHALAWLHRRPSHCHCPVFHLDYLGY